MSDKLEWQNQHLVLLDSLSIEEIKQKGGYKMPSMVAHKYPNETNVQSLFFKLGIDEDYRSGCELLSAAVHKRALVWWGYSVMLDLLREVAQCPYKEKPLEDYGKLDPLPLPEWAKFPEEDPIDPEVMAEFQKSVTAAKAHLDKVLKSVPPEAIQMLEESRARVEDAIRAQCGMAPSEMLKRVMANYKPDMELVDEANSPIYKEMAELRERLEKIRKDTISKVKAAFPQEAPGFKEKLRADALDSVWAWIAAPEAVNAKRCMVAGNETKDTEEGLLALVAFWSYGNLSDSPDVFVPTPPGLASIGFNGFLLKCALHKGGLKSFKERYNEYYRLGLEVATGRLNWSGLLDDRISPHRKIVPMTSASEGSGRFREAPQAFESEPKPKGFGR